MPGALFPPPRERRFEANNKKRAGHARSSNLIELP